MLSVAVARIFDLIFYLLLIYVFLSWIPSIKWNSQPFVSLRSFAEIFFSPFRKFIPPIEMFDISVIVAFIVLHILRVIIIYALVALGL